MECRQDLFGKYYRLDKSHRIDYLCDNFRCFPKMIAGYESKIKMMIEGAKTIARREARGELGVRVQTSSISDMTFDEVADNMEIEAAIEAGKAEGRFFEGLEELQIINDGLYELGIMKQEYSFFKTQIDNASENFDVFTTYITGTQDIDELADKLGISYHSAKNVIWKQKKAFKTEIIDFMREYA